MRGQKGITLVALIITIVVLLILAVVAISAITDTGVVDYSKNATETWNQVEKNELETLGGYENWINNAATNVPQ